MDVQKLLHSVLSGQSSHQAGSHTAHQSGSSSGSGLADMARTVSGNLPGGLLGGAAAGGVMAAIMGSKKVRKFGGKALTYGGLAVLGGLAYKAWSDHRRTSRASNPCRRRFRPRRVVLSTQRHFPTRRGRTSGLRCCRHDQCCAGGRPCR